MTQFGVNTSDFYVKQLQRNSTRVETATQQLSSGRRINRAADDAAGLSISENLDARVRGSNVAEKNIQLGVNILNIAQDGIENGFMPILRRMRDLTLSAASGTKSDADVKVVQQEMDTIKEDLIQAFYAAHDARIQLDGKDSADRILEFQVGPNGGQYVEVDFNDLRDHLRQFIVDVYGYEEIYNNPRFQEFLVPLFPTGGGALPPHTVLPPGPYPPGSTPASLFPKKMLVDPPTGANINATLNMLDKHFEDLNSDMAYFGSKSNQLELAYTALSQTKVQLMNGISQIRDTDMAAAVAEMTKAQVIQQSSVAMLAQANTRTQQVLQLLQPN